MSDEIKAYQNTDRELWREREDDFYANSIHVTEGGGIGMNVGGTVVVMPIAQWHARAMSEPLAPAPDPLKAEVHFLLDRLEDFERNGSMDSDELREWGGHVVPSIARLRTLSKLDEFKP